MATIKDVSALAGVSIKTVSRVLNESTEVAEPTRQRVLAAITELDYRPNMLAKRLVTGKTNTVGVVIPRSAAYVFSHLYFNEVLRGIGEVLGQQQLDLLLHLAHDDTPYAELYRQQRVDGLILMSIPSDDPYLPGVIESGAPAVFTCRIREQNNPTHWVDADAEGGMARSVEHLLRLGHRRIAFLSGPPALVLARLQREGYRRSLINHGISIDEGLIAAGDYSFEAGHHLARTMMARDDPPTAFVCGDDMTALGAMRGVEEQGYRVPADVSIIGFDDVILARYVSPALTTVRQAGHRKGQLATQMLIRAMAGDLADGPRQVVLDTELVVRESTGPAPARRRNPESPSVSQITKAAKGVTMP
ncbi:MAG TPA: LacI family DNA-binding transcriptional regulator [Thermomicrobiales bacterium]|nr:LacI family DNA-binding transcriptional regulator [Thermomicrobiales bacterium]